MKNKIPYFGQTVILIDNKEEKYAAVWKGEFIYISDKPDLSKCYIEYWIDADDYNTNLVDFSRRLVDGM